MVNGLQKRPILLKLCTLLVLLKIFFFILGIKCDNFRMGLKIDFKFEISALVNPHFFEINFSNSARAAVSSPALVTSRVPRRALPTRSRLLGRTDGGGGWWWMVDGGWMGSKKVL